MSKVGCMGSEQEHCNQVASGVANEVPRIPVTAGRRLDELDQSPDGDREACSKRCRAHLASKTVRVPASDDGRKKRRYQPKGHDVPEIVQLNTGAQAGIWLWGC